MPRSCRLFRRAPADSNNGQTTALDEVASVHMRGAARFVVRTLAFGALKVFRRAENFLRPLVYATFTSKELDAQSVAEWEAFGETGPVTGETLLGWERDLFARQIRPNDSLLVVGAGNGRDVLPLLDSLLPFTLERKAKAQGLSVKTIRASITEADLPPAAFDVVMFSWFTFGYLRGGSSRAAALARSGSALKPGGRIILSYIAEPSSSLTASSNVLASLTARALDGAVVEPGDQINVSGSLIRPGVFMSHTFKPADVEKEVTGLGFRVLEHSHPTSGVGILVLAAGS